MNLVRGILVTVLLTFCTETIAQTQHDSLQVSNSDLTTGTTPHRVDDAAELETFLDGAISVLQLAHHSPSIVVSIVHNDQVAFSKGYGFADVERSIPVEPGSTLFRSGSVSKGFTWTAVMQLVERGVLDLDADVNTYLTQFQIPATYGEPVTLRHILSHTAGFEDGGVGYLFREREQDLTSLAEALHVNMPARVRPPGIYSSYSNWATGLAGLIVANQSGLDFDSYIEENIFEPLGMSRSTFREPVPIALAGSQSANFVRAGGDYVDAGFEFIHDFGPAGSLSTTADDMAKWMLALLGDGEYRGNRIIGAEIARQMREPLHRHHDNVNAMLHGFFERSPNGRKGFGHSGDTLYFHSDFVILPDEGVGIFVSATANDGRIVRKELVRLFFDRYFPARTDGESDTDRAASPPPSSDLDSLSEYLGAYRVNRRSYETWEKVLSLLGGDLVVQVSPRGGLSVLNPVGGIANARYVEYSNDVFRSVDDIDDQIVFLRNDTGDVTHLLNKKTPYAAFDKLRWFELAKFHSALLGFGLVTMLGLVVCAIWRRSTLLRMSKAKLFTLSLLLGASLLNLVFGLLLYSEISKGYVRLFVDGVPAISWILALPMIATLLAVIACLMFGPLWTGRYWTLFARVGFMLATGVLLAFAWSLSFWNLLGPWNS